jgi:hypothetical protein
MIGDQRTTGPGAATAVSGCSHRVGAFVQSFEGLARWSLAMGSMLLALTGCLDGTPEYRVPTRAPPVIITDLVVPNTTKIWLIPSQQPSEHFNVPFRSEDANVDLVWAFWQDLDPSKPENVRTQFLQQGFEVASELPFDEQGTNRSVDWTWPLDVGRPTGCLSVTLILTHEDNKQKGTISTPIDEARAARLTWWFDFEDPDPAATPDLGCQPTQPGGT